MSYREVISSNVVVTTENQHSKHNMYGITFNEKRSHKHEREQGGIHRKIWKEEREGGEDVIIL